MDQTGGPGAPLSDADPRQLGAYRLRRRLSAGPSGVVYAAVDGGGRAAEVALLSEGAAADADARALFSAAVQDGTGVRRGPAVLASGTDGTAAAWVATESGRGGAAAYLGPVDSGAGPAGRGAPQLAPHWSARAAPSSVRWFWPASRGAGAGVADAPPQRAVVLGMLLLLLLAALLVVLLYFWLAALSQSAGGAASEPSPSPSGSPSDSPSPSPSQSGEPSEPGPSGEPSSVPSAPLDDEDMTGAPQDPDTLA
ncbi:hypothetical protein [Nocardiopsis coralliicola]